MRYSSGNLFGYAWLTFTLTRLKVHAEGGVACKDQHGRSYESGFHYIPGPEPCTFCICDNGNPKLCKAFICKFLEEDCKSFRRGDACCEFICLDDTLSSISNDKPDGAGTNIIDGNANYDLGLRSVASFVTAILSMSLLFFLIHRLRQRKIQGRENRQIGEDQRSLGNMGYLERGGLLHGVPMDDIPCGTGYSLWKPPGNYFPRGEAPPPYEEAVAAARAEQALLSMNPHTLLSMNFSDSYMPSGNNHTSIAVVANTPNHELTVNTQPSSNDNHISSAPLMSSSSNRPLSSPGTYVNYRPVSQSSTTSTGLNTSTSTTSFTMGTNMYENLPVSIGTTSFNDSAGQHSGGGGLVSAQQQQPVLPISHSTIPKSYRQHTTTFPRQSGGGAFTISATLSNSDVSSSHRTIPRTLTTQRVVATSRAKDVSTDCSAKDYLRLSPGSITPQSLSHSVQLSPVAIPASYKDTKNVDVFYTDVPVASASALPQPSDCVSTYTTHTVDVSEKTREFKPSLSVANEINASGSFESVTCTCSMQALPTLHDDTDDYRSECENCKSATGSRYYLDNEDELVTSLHETMTLHRRPDDAASSATPQYYRTSLTLPTSTRQRTRITGARENWFSTMPESSSGSSDEN